jgi:uncharacterized LabA/DUF88 family protein
MNNVYFFIDGSALTAQIRQLQRAEPLFRDRKLCPKELLRVIMYSLSELHGRSYKRAVFYFPRGDEAAVEKFIAVPDHNRPGVVRDLHFKFCGHKLKKSAEFDKFVEENVPTKFQDRFQKSEKGIDIEMCCDALRLASTGKLERLFLLTNDGDNVPLCRALKEFGSNISILHLSEATPPNADLVRESDSYDVVPKTALNLMFVPVPAAEPAEPILPHLAEESPTADGAQPESEKPDIEPSAMTIEPEAMVKPSTSGGAADSEALDDDEPKGTA